MRKQGTEMRIQCSGLAGGKQDVLTALIDSAFPDYLVQGQDQEDDRQ